MPGGTSDFAAPARRHLVFHREYRRLDARRQVQLGKDMPHVQFDGVVTDVQLAGNHLVTFSQSKVRENFPLALGQ